MNLRSPFPYSSMMSRACKFDRAEESFMDVQQLTRLPLVYCMSSCVQFPTRISKLIPTAYLLGLDDLLVFEIHFWTLWALGGNRVKDFAIVQEAISFLDCVGIFQAIIFHLRIINVSRHQLRNVFSLGHHCTDWMIHCTLHYEYGWSRWR